MRRFSALRLLVSNGRQYVLTEASGLYFSTVRKKTTDFTALRAVVPNLDPPDVLGLQAPEILASTTHDEGFWEL